MQPAFKLRAGATDSKAAVNLDPLTMVVVIIISTVLIGGGLLVTRNYFGEVRGAKQWAVATLLQAVGWIVIGPMRMVLPETVSGVLGPLLVQSCRKAIASRQESSE